MLIYDAFNIHVVNYKMLHNTLYTVDATEYVTAQIDATFHEVSEELKII